jgi:hypothetical protein
MAVKPTCQPIKKYQKKKKNIWVRFGKTIFLTEQSVVRAFRLTVMHACVSRGNQKFEH